MTDHPLTEEAAAERWNADARLIPWDDWGPVGRAAILSAFRDMHDAGREHEQANLEDNRPWEPLNGGPLRVGDEVRQDFRGVTHTAVVARVVRSGDPWTAEGAIIGLLCDGTWHVRRVVRELPTEDGAVIVPNDGCEYITATDGGVEYRAREAVLTRGGVWQGAWRSADGFLTAMHPGQINPGTWKVDER